jgi:hypothetical protein
MNAGFANFDTLKKHLLAGSSAKSDTRFDTAIKAVGLGVAAAIENYTNRKFFRTADDTYISSADRAEFILPRYPVESVSLIEQKNTEADGWVTLDQSPWDLVQTFDLSAGIVRFADDNDLGNYSAQIRFTFTGGYWWETAEPDDPAYPSQMPAGATPLPNDLKLAWLLQCEAVWAARDKLGTGLIDKPETQSATGKTVLSPLVKQMLGQYIRYQLT